MSAQFKEYPKDNSNKPRTSEKDIVMSKSEAVKIKKDLPLRVSQTPHTSVDAEDSPSPKAKGAYPDGTKTTRTPKKFPVRKGNESAQQ
jgi:hypothetical protein